MRRCGAIVIGVVLGGVVTAMACTVPVFRFALDRWEADAYRLFIPAAWATRSDLVKLLVPLRGNGVANVSIVEVDDPGVSEAVLRFPFENEEVWRGALDAEAMASLLDSPGRRKVVEKLLAGDSVVWVVFAGEGDAEEVDRVAKRLSFLEQVASLSVQNPNDPDSQLGPGPPLRLGFSVLPLALGDPAEAIFARMLAGPEGANVVENGSPFAAAVFGRGRVLGAWALAELDDTMIEDSSLFLIGRCSCRVKNESPGWDVVLQVDWENELQAAAEARVTEIPVPKQSDAVVETKVIGGGGEPNEDSEVDPEERPSTAALLGIVVALCLVGGLVLWFKR